jgi:hypothetical protein
MLITALLLSLGSVAAYAGEAAGPVISDAWVRALPPGQPNTAAYMTITNPGVTAVRIVAARTELAARAEIHTTREVDGYQRMEQLKVVDLAAGQSVSFAPGGVHLMLFGLTHMPVPGDEVPLCLQLAEEGEVCTVASVRKTAAGQVSHEHHQH